MQGGAKNGVTLFRHVWKYRSDLYQIWHKSVILTRNLFQSNLENKLAQYSE